MDQAQSKIVHSALEKAGRFSRRIHLLIVAVLLTTVGFFCQVAYWAWWPEDVMQIKSITVLADSVEPEGDLTFALDYCKGESFEDIHAGVQYSLVDRVVYNLLGQGSGPLAPGCHVSTEVIALPVVPAGTYRLQMDRNYQINPIRTISRRAISNTFEVRARSISAVDPVLRALLKANQQLIEKNVQLIRDNSRLTQQNSRLLTDLSKLLTK